MQDLPNDDDPDGTVFSSLRPNSMKQTRTSAKLRWNKVKGAARYNIYAAKCGTKYKLTRVATVKGTSKTIRKISGKAGNYRAVKTKAKKNKVRLRKGKSFKLRAKAVKQFKKKPVKKHETMRYESGNRKIATVTSKGTIKAVGKGTCYVCAYAQNGVYKRIRVTVR